MTVAVVVVTMLAVALVSLSLVALVRPQVITGIGQLFVDARGIWIAVTIRVVAAVALWFAAPATQFPVVFRILAVIALIAAVAVLLIGYERAKRLIDWAIGRPPAVLRMFAVIALLLGGFLLWALFG